MVGFSGERHSGRFAPLEKTNTGVLRFAQNDDVKQAKTTAKTKADPYGMTNNKGNDNNNDNNNDNSNGNGNGNGENTGIFPPGSG
jgi:hypothetical protein